MDSKSDFPISTEPSIIAVQSFEARLAAPAELRWALDEGSLFLDGKGAVHASLRKVCKRLDEANIPYAVAGGMALYVRGFQRFTKDIDILVSREGLSKIHEQLEGLGYIRLFRGSKNLRDTQTGVAIEFLLAGQFPGDGKPKPVSFPDPSEVGELTDGIRYLNLATLIELKIASGMTNPDRMKDLVDVQELIRALRLSKTFGEKLNPYVRPKYEELWQSIRTLPKQFVRLWTRSAETAAELDAIQAAGVRVEETTEAPGDELRLVTDDPQLAARFDMHEESEFWDGGQ